jgi:hypothetical protein
LIWDDLERIAIARGSIIADVIEKRQALVEIRIKDDAERVHRGNGWI